MKIELKSEAAKQQAKASRKVSFAVRNLPRGRYVLRVTKEKEEKSKQLEALHILLE